MRSHPVPAQSHTATTPLCVLSLCSHSLLLCRHLLPLCRHALPCPCAATCGAPVQPHAFASHAARLMANTGDAYALHPPRTSFIFNLPLSGPPGGTPRHALMLVACQDGITVQHCMQRYSARGKGRGINGIHDIPTTRTAVVNDTRSSPVCAALSVWFSNSSSVANTIVQ